MSSGVSWGLSVGPPQCKSFINDLEENTKSLLVKLTDDTRISRELNNNKVRPILQNKLYYLIAGTA